MSAQDDQLPCAWTNTSRYANICTHLHMGLVDSYPPFVAGVSECFVSMVGGLTITTTIVSDNISPIVLSVKPDKLPKFRGRKKKVDRPSRRQLENSSHQLFSEPDVLSGDSRAQLAPPLTRELYQKPQAKSDDVMSVQLCAFARSLGVDSSLHI